VALYIKYDYTLYNKRAKPEYQSGSFINHDRNLKKRTPLQEPKKTAFITIQIKKIRKAW
jgi:hypothetical protein